MKKEDFYRKKPQNRSVEILKARPFSTRPLDSANTGSLSSGRSSTVTDPGIQTYYYGILR
jgi:hypothetical protein